MSLKKTKDQLIYLLDQAENKVIALSGKWGTGKTHLWNEVKKESSDDGIKKSLYVSLFGQSSVDQIKRKLIEMAIPKSESNVHAISVLKNLFTTGVKAASTHYKALAAISDLNILLMAPVILRDKVIVIDDIERKHEKLGIDEVLGFIDEYSNQYGARFILILNDDQLSDKSDQDEIWTTFREKVIDEEIRLSTSAEEAFSIAISLTPSNHVDALRSALISCGVNNIRIVCKVIRAANRIIGDMILESAIQARIIPSIVLFSAIHYRGIEDGPDFQFALSAGGSEWLGLGRDETQEPSDEEKAKDRWRLLMQELGIESCDDFEQILVDFLESGLLDADKIRLVIDGYIRDKEKMDARLAADEFLFRFFWDHHASDVQLSSDANLLVPIAKLLDPYAVTNLVNALIEIEGAEEIGQRIINNWMAEFKKTGQANVNIDHLNINSLHPDIVNAFKEFEGEKITNTALLDVCMRIFKMQAWGSTEERVMRDATVSDFEAVIRDMDIKNLSRYMRGMIDMRLNKGAYDAHFGTATAHFMEACKTIVNDSGSPRLARIIRRIFEQTSLISELDSGA